jgi:hypothetical protein
MLAALNQAKQLLFSDKKETKEKDEAAGPEAAAEKPRTDEPGKQDA